VINKGGQPRVKVDVKGYVSSHMQGPTV